MEIALRNARLSHSGALAAITIEGGKVRSVTPDSHCYARQTLDAGGAIVLAGFIDLHTHGAAGADTMDGTRAALDRMSRFYAEHGVTAFLPATVTADGPSTTRAIDAVRDALARPLPGARVIGIHLEGPYLAENRPGAQAPEHIRPADPSEYGPWLESGVVRLITLAPEIAANRRLLRDAVARGIAVSAGHSSVSYDEIDTLAQEGLSGVTHSFNAMPGLHHRVPGLAGAALTRGELYAEVIVDGVHIHPAVVQLIFRAKGPDRTLLVTDSMRATGMPEGTYTLGDRLVSVRAGQARLADGTLAGSTLTMDAALRNAIQLCGATLTDAATMAAATPARRLGIGNRGRISPGYVADLVLLDPESLAVQMTLVRGEVVYRR